MAAISNEYSMQSAMANVAESNLNNQKRTIERLGNSKSAEQVEKEKLKEACQGFESIFIQKMWEQMRASLPKDGLMSSSKDEKFWQGMYDQELSKSMTNAGGIGLTDMMMEQMSRNKTDTASASKASEARTQGLNVPPAQILPNIEKAKEDFEAQRKLATMQKDVQQNAQAKKPLIDESMYEDIPEEKLATVEQEKAVQASQNNDTSIEAQAQPIVQTITYQTNLPKNKRNGDKVVQQLLADQEAKAKAAALAEQLAKQAQENKEETKVHRVESKGLPTIEFEELSSNMQGAQNPVNTLENKINSNLIASTKENTLHTNKPENKSIFDEDILAGISQRYIKTNSYNDNRLIATNSQHQADLQPKLAGGPDLLKPHLIEDTDELGYLAYDDSSFASPVEGKVTSGFGWRLDPVNGKRSWHNGIDIAADYASPVKAADSGIVTFAGYDEELGNMLIIEHANGLSSIYGHNSELTVKENDFVEKGTDIARIGSTGRTVGNHLHFEIRKQDMPINPETLLNRNIIGLS